MTDTPQGIAFTLDGVDELTFARILRDAGFADVAGQ